MDTTFCKASSDFVSSKQGTDETASTKYTMALKENNNNGSFCIRN